MSSLLVFNRVYRLEIQTVMLIFSTQLCELFPSNLLSTVKPNTTNNSNNFYLCLCNYCTVPYTTSRWLKPPMKFASDKIITKKLRIEMIFSEIPLENTSYVILLFFTDFNFFHSLQYPPHQILRSLCDINNFYNFFCCTATPLRCKYRIFSFSFVK